MLSVTWATSSGTILLSHILQMPLNAVLRVKQMRALMLAVKLDAEGFISEMGLRPGESIEVGGLVFTAPSAARFAPFIELLNKEIETAA